MVLLKNEKIKTMKYKGIKLKEITIPQIVDPPKEMIVWDRDDREDIEPLKRKVCAIVKHKNLNIAITTDIAHFCHCAEIPEEAKPRRATYRELAKWLAQGKGEASNGGFSGIFHFYGYSTCNENEQVSLLMKIRKWDDTEWHEPTVDYMGIE